MQRARKMILSNSGLRIGLPCVAVFLLAGFCFGQPSVSLSPTSGPPTTGIHVSGSGFKPHAAIDIYFDKKHEKLVISDGSGSFKDVLIHAPRNAKPGTHQVSAIQRSGKTGAQAPFLVQTDWNQFHYTASGTRLNPYENVLSPKTVGRLVLKWSYAGVGGESSATVANGMVFVTEATDFEAWNASTGAGIWTYYTGDFAFFGSAVADGIVYFGCWDDNVYALNASTGAKVWSYPTNDRVYSVPAVVNGAVYFASRDNNVYAVKASNGEYLWKYNTGSPVFSSPTVVNNVVYVANDVALYALDASAGTELWSYSAYQTFSSPTVANGVVYFASDGSGTTYALNASTGGLVWSYFTGSGSSSSPAVANGAVYIGGNNNVSALNASTGTLLWSYTTGGQVTSSPAVANGVVYVGSNDNNVYALNAKTGAKLWSYLIGHFVDISSPIVVNGMVYVGSDDGKLYAFGLK